MSDAKDGLIGKKFPVLDQGWVKLAGVMGSDQTIVDRARGTIGESARKVSSDADLINLMMRKNHGSSFEFPEIDIQVCTPFVVWRQMILHRAGNILDEMTMWDEPSVNELSGRYSVLPEMIQATPPREWRKQSKSNRQGSGENFPESDGVAFSSWESDATKAALKTYDSLIARGVAKEQARKVYPMGGYTIGFMKMDLRNWLHWLALRLPLDAQLEIQLYARVLAHQIVQPLFPQTYTAFQNYTLNAMSLSWLDVMAVRSIQQGKTADEALDACFRNKRERTECAEKLKRLGLIEGDMEAKGA